MIVDIIISKLNKKISFLEKSQKPDSSLIPYYQTKIEYYLILILAYLWNKNYQSLEVDLKERILDLIIQPTLGQVFEMCRNLDSKEKEILNKKANKIFDKYLYIRNHKIGHGYTYEDGLQKLKLDFKALISDLESNLSIKLIDQNIDFILVENVAKKVYSGIAYRSNGDYEPWSCPEKIQDFATGNLYILNERGDYFRVSPFIKIDSEDDYFLFNKIQERLTGKVKYNQIVKTGNTFFEWSDFVNLNVEEDGSRRKSINKTIINTFENNYSKYIDLGLIKEKIRKFVLDNKASVAATVWGHGGVGKTATIQYICEELLNSTQKIFDYIIFLSAKDRYYDYLTGTIQSIESKINSFESLIKKINYVIFSEEKYDLDKILEFEGQLFLVIDDYETFLAEDKKKIEDFIRRLDINHHKVVVTTRANLILGHEIQINELSPEETKRFLVRLQEIEFPNVKPFDESELTEDKVSIIHKITSGRPLFIFQFAYVTAQRGIPSALGTDYKIGEVAVDFLYGRIFEYLSPTAQNIFVIMGLLTADDNGDLTNLIEKVKYILNLEHKEDVFQAAITELEKLRIVEIIDSKFFKVYSHEIQSIMLKYYQASKENFRRGVSQRLTQISRDKGLDNEWALLSNANNSRYSKNEAEVVTNYRQILNRPSCPHDAKLQAIINLGSYLFTERGKKELAIQTMEDYSSQYLDDPQFIKMYSTYTWSLGSRSHREKSIQILLDYFSKRKERSLSKDINLELLGNLLTNRAIYWIDHREETKYQYSYEEISVNEFRERQKNEKEQFKDIYKNQGIIVFNFLRNHNINEISSGARQNAIAGVYQFVNICIRLKRYDIGRDVCQFALKKFPKNQRIQFSNKLQLINKYSGKDYSYNPL